MRFILFIDVGGPKVGESGDVLSNDNINGENIYLDVF